MAARPSSPLLIALAVWLAVWLAACVAAVDELEAPAERSTTYSAAALTCPNTTATLADHVSEGRAYKESFVFIFWTIDWFYATGTRESLGADPNRQATLYENAPGMFSTTPSECEGSSATSGVGRDFESPYLPVVLDVNVGRGFESPIASSDTGDGSGCALFAALFGQDPERTEAFIKIPPELNMALYTVYRPAQLDPGRKYPVVTWGNGTCALPEGQGEFLRFVASHGIIVVAAHSRQVGSTGAMGRALDWAFAANADPSSPYYQKFDLDNVGAAGHSQGSATASTLATLDPRVKTVVLLNGGTSNIKPFLGISGDRDLGGGPAAYETGVAGASVEAAYLFFHDIPMTGSFDGHLTLISQPERVGPHVAAWLRMMLAGDTAARDWLLESDCEACGDYEFGAENF